MLGQSVIAVALLAFSGAANAQASLIQDLAGWIASIQSTPDGTRVRLLDTPILEVLEFRQRVVGASQSDEFRLLATPLLALVQIESDSDSVGTSTNGEIASVGGVQLLAWQLERQKSAGEEPRAFESFQLLEIPQLGSLLRRQEDEDRIEWGFLYLLHFSSEKVN